MTTKLERTYKKLVDFKLSDEALKERHKHYGTFPNLAGEDVYDDWPKDDVERILLEESVHQAMQNALNKSKIKKDKINYEFSKLTRAEEKELFDYWQRRDKKLPQLSHPWEDPVSMMEILDCYQELEEETEEDEPELAAAKVEVVPPKPVSKLMIVYYDLKSRLEDWKKTNPVLNNLPGSVGVVYMPVAQEHVRIEFVNLI